MDNIVNRATEHGPYTYNYDSLYRLVTADGGPLSAERYTYDPVGNRLTSATANNWTYNSNNELQSYNGVAFQYDQNGNTTQKNDNGTIQNFLYNEDDRLTEVKDGSGAVVATYYYDPFGRRLWKEIGGARTNFMYADEGLIAEFDGTGSEAKSYGYAPNSTWTTNPLFMKQGTQYYFYHNDHLGTPQKMTSVTGAIVWSAKYESFGNAVIDASSTIENNLRFPGQYYDQESGLHYNWHRYYDPRVGRYATTDPLGSRRGRNRPYLYAAAMPTKKIDPPGLEEYSTWATDGGYGWPVAYEQSGCAITVRIKLTGTPVPLDVLAAWEDGITKKWSGKYSCCEPGLTCGRTLCTVTINVKWVTSGEHQSVEVHMGDPTIWDQTSTDIWYLDDTDGDTAAHEAGHFLENKDEYPDMKGYSPNRFPINTGTVMDNNFGPAVGCHFNQICRNIGGVVCKDGVYE
jgi:RHS repeat-associated protein